jgi:cysteine desulfurase/selenocysteine lyase
MVLVDGAQSTPHMQVDMKRIGCDFFALSGHKMLGPTGTGALYANEKTLDHMEPLFTGGDMINTVTYESYDWNELPWKFEAGTSNIAGGIGLGSAIDYIKKIGLNRIDEHEKSLMEYAVETFSRLKGVRLFVTENPSNRAGILSFAIDGVHPHDVSQIFDSEGIAIRAGHHCAMPLVTERLCMPALSRISFYLYNTKEEIDRAAAAVEKVKRTFRL